MRSGSSWRSMPAARMNWSRFCRHVAAADSCAATRSRRSSGRRGRSEPGGTLAAGFSCSISVEAWKGWSFCQQKAAVRLADVPGAAHPEASGLSRSSARSPASAPGGEYCLSCTSFSAASMSPTKREGGFSMNWPKGARFPRGCGWLRPATSGRVEEPPLLRDVHGLAFALVWEQPFLAADDQHHRETPAPSTRAGSSASHGGPGDRRRRSHFAGGRLQEVGQAILERHGTQGELIEALTSAAS